VYIYIGTDLSVVILSQKAAGFRTRQTLHARKMFRLKKSRRQSQCAVDVFAIPHSTTPTTRVYRRPKDCERLCMSCYRATKTGGWMKKQTRCQRNFSSPRMRDRETPDHHACTECDNIETKALHPVRICQGTRHWWRCSCVSWLISEQDNQVSAESGRECHLVCLALCAWEGGRRAGCICSVK